MTVFIEADCNDTVAHLSGVHIAVIRTAHEGAARATATLDSHKNRPNRNKSKRHSRIEVTDLPVDALVSLVDPDGGAQFIEFGARGWHGTRALSSMF
jgi:hypothetical protein